MLLLGLASPVVSFGAADFALFLAEVKKALARNYAKAVTELTQLPFLFENQPRDQAALEKIYPQLFDAKVRG